MPPAAGRLSTTTGCAKLFLSLSPMVRAMTSSELPAGADTTKRIALEGYWAYDAAEASDAMIASVKRMFLIHTTDSES